MSWLNEKCSPFFVRIPPTCQNCTECRLPLARSSYIITIGGLTDHWHAECFKCAVCREPMDKRQSCHLVRDQVICHNDYLRLKRDCTVNCARCRWPIAASDWVSLRPA